ncbi:MAG: NADH-quinone oxidoreductase subunit NuoK [Planctomycetota bacterium]|nr:MAG: NADH-quinone oxidoreductase subunit NuoK [Planctomycetota bacterium]
MAEITLLYHYLTVGAVLFGLGAIGFVARRNMILMFLCAEMMLQGVAISGVAWSWYRQDLGGQLLVVFVIAVAAAEAAVALALIMMIFRAKGTLDIAALQHLREEETTPYVDHDVPPDEPRPRRWPHLAVAGKKPALPPEATEFRDDV